MSLCARVSGSVTTRSTRLPFAAPISAARSARTVSRVMPTNAIKIWVKGDPATGVLGDCPFCHRTLLALELKGLSYEKELVDFSNKPQIVLDLSEKGTVPVMTDGDEVIPDSGAIVEYLDKTYDPKLARPDEPSLASKLLPAFVNYLKSSPEECPEYSPELVEQLQELNDYLAADGNGPFIGGETMSASDCLLAPRIYHVAVALPHFKGHDAFEGRFPAVTQYLEDFQATKAFKNTYYHPDIIVGGWAAHDGVNPPSA